jgi:DNA-binding transcriptional MerR regulator/methylmalonyl-CoA mutase cobalamin-binding subunit
MDELRNLGLSSDAPIAEPLEFEEYGAIISDETRAWIMSQRSGVNHMDKPSTSSGESNVRLSIGAVSKATDIPKETLRTWERRYEFPDPGRNEAGHRIYTLTDVERLRLISQAIDAGQRASQVVGSSIEELQEIVDASRVTRVEEDSAPAPSGESESLPGEIGGVGGAGEREQKVLKSWLRSAIELDEDRFVRELERAWFRRGAVDFLSHLLAPFLEELGNAWYEGRIAVLHENFASKHIRNFLEKQWKPLSNRARGARVICATLPGEFHALGLHMIATVLSMSGFQIEDLEVGIEPERLVEMVEEREPSYVMISISRAASRHVVRESLLQLIETLPEDVELLIGGAGAPTRFEGASYIPDLGTLAEWARERIPATSLET